MYDDFELTEEQRAIQTLAREFAQEHIKPIAAEIDRMDVGTNVAESFPWDLIKEAHKLGFKTIAMPKEYGGEEADALTQVIIMDEFAYADSTCCKIITQQWKVPQTIVNFGTKDQKDRFLGALRDEPTYLMCGSITEPDSDKTLFGSPKGGPMLAVERKKDGYVLNGTKRFIALAGVASLCNVAGRTDKTVRPRLGTSQFLVPWGTPGFSRIRIHDKIGWRVYANAELAFDDVYVPKENLLGGKENMDTSERALELTRGGNEIELAANAMGMTRAAFEAALDYAKQRVQGGKPIIEHQLIGGLLADMYMDLQAGRSFVWHVAWLGSHGKKIDQALSLSCTRFCSEVVRRVTQQALSIFGGMGVMKELPMERYVRDSQIFMHLGGNPHRQATVGYLLGGLNLDGQAKPL